ncbi:MAG: polyprenol monophosphomannose synthase [Micrococcales bacterium]
MSNQYLVIMPTYNEVSNLANSADEVLRYNPNVDLLIVDDNSPDGTGNLAAQLAKDDKRISVLHRTDKQGLGPAYLAGFEYAFSKSYKYVIEMDADGSHRAADLVKLILESPTSDLVIGSRWVSGGAVVNWPNYRKAISKFGNFYTRVMLGTKVRDMTAGYRIYKTELLKRLDLTSIASHGYSFQVEMAWRSIQTGAVVTEVPITFIERERGVSKMTGSIVVEALWLVTKWGLARLFKS